MVTLAGLEVNYFLDKCRITLSLINLYILLAGYAFIHENQPTQNVHLKKQKVFYNLYRMIGSRTQVAIKIQRYESY